MTGPPPLRVEKALEILPDLEALAPLRALVLSLARADERQLWSSSGPYLTVGKRGIDSPELRGRLPRLLHLVAEHMGSLYEGATDAVEALQRSDAEKAVAALLAAGEREETVGRIPQACAWYEAARPLAAGLQSRRPETECLRRLAEACRALGRYDDGARHYQRGLALAEAEFDQAGAITASLGLGDIARARGEWVGASAWYQRALRLADAAGDAAGLGRAERRLGLLAHHRGDLTAATEHLRRAREHLEGVGDAAELARALSSQGLVEAALGREAAALAAYREALAWTRRAPADPAREVGIRLSIAELAIEGGRLLEAEEELRRAEEVALGRNVATCLLRIYALMGRLRGMQDDETGFVFFEQAIALCGTLSRSPADEARLYHEYGLFRSRRGDGEEARVHLEHARELFESLGQGVELARVEEELKRLTA